MPSAIKTILSFCLLFFIFCPLSLAIQPVQTELAIAKGCYLYDSGKLNEALTEFQAILLKDPNNQAARDYVDKIWLKLHENGITSSELNEEILGYKNALYARKKIEINDQERLISSKDDESFTRFINNTTIGYNRRRLGEGTDTSFYPGGFFVEEHVGMNSSSKKYQQDISMDVRHHENGHDDTRLRRITYSINNNAGTGFILGDTSTQFSRYTLRGMYYRGADFYSNGEKNSFKILAGVVPHFMAKTSTKQTNDRNYIYPRQVYAVRDAYKPVDSYTVGVSYMELRDSESVHDIDTNLDPKLNRVVSIDQNIVLVPNKWKIQTESAYSTSNEDRSDTDILVTDKNIKDFANYVQSVIQTPRFKLVNSYESIGPDFRSYADLASTTSSWLSAITSDREKIDNYMEYQLFESNPFYFDLNLSRVRNNLGNESNMGNIEMNRQTNYGGGFRYIPDEDQWMPQSSIRLKIMDTLSTPGSEFVSNDVSDRDIIFELAKKIYGVDLSTSYTRRKEIENIDTFGNYINIYDIMAAKQLTDMILLSASYSHSDTQKSPNGDVGTTGRGDFFDINAALQLWAGANLSLGYGYDDTSDNTGITNEGRINIYSATFSWPFNKYFLSNGSELTLMPYLTYQLNNGQYGDNKNRAIWSAALDATYTMPRDNRISLSALYRNDMNWNYSVPIGSSSTEVDDYRFLLTYQKIFQ